jgi:hypothetical protein
MLKMKKYILPKDFNFDKMMPFLAQENEVRAGHLGGRVGMMGDIGVGV